MIKSIILSKFGLLVGLLLTAGVYFNDNITTVDEPIDPIAKIHLEYDLALSNIFVFEGERHTLALGTYGGMVFVKDEMVEVIKASKVPVDTYVEKFTASAGAMLFTEGEHRIMHKDAKIMFHGVSLNGTILTEPTINKMIDFVDSGKFEGVIFGTYRLSTLEELDLMKMLLMIANSQGFSKAAEFSKYLLEEFKVINQRMLLDVYKLVSVKHPHLTLDDVKRIVFANYERDVVLTAQQAFDLGIATEIRG